ncbi:MULTISPECIES: hypothetical protein [unclassified Sphingobacterium]|uniref:hypothetical protein n=1 Tax=unclassified Sphingobacterium TaxID=2609468 RepID=UPI00106FADF4|nr:MULTISPECIES: hypothetical protein [unclassified Sphingobacterium]QBR13754.1 hypothetical protein E3D81_16810 [Sphingobacterium sp. CZ-2]
MKKTNFKIRFCKTLVLMVALINFVGCSKDDDNPNQGTGSIDVAVGTYKGAYRIDGVNYFNAVLIVSKVDDNRLKFDAKAGEPYSHAASRTIRAKADVPGLVNGDDAQGLFGYKIAEKKLTLVVNTLEIPYSFEGEKQ